MNTAAQRAGQGAPAIPAIPPADVLGRVAALASTPTPELKQQWRELFGQKPTIFNRPYLISRLTCRMQELAYGGVRHETRARLQVLEWTSGGLSYRMVSDLNKDELAEFITLINTPDAVGSAREQLR